MQLVALLQQCNDSHGGSQDVNHFSLPHIYHTIHNTPVNWNSPKCKKKKHTQLNFTLKIVNSRLNCKERAMIAWLDIAWTLDRHKCLFIAKTVKVWWNGEWCKCYSDWDHFTWHCCFNKAFGNHWLMLCIAVNKSTDCTNIVQLGMYNVGMYLKIFIYQLFNYRLFNSIIN